MYVLFIIKLARFLCLMVNDCDVSLLQFMLPSLQLVGDAPPPKKNNRPKTTELKKHQYINNQHLLLSTGYYQIY
jgi:hypothetical protein